MTDVTNEAEIDPITNSPEAEYIKISAEVAKEMIDSQDVTILDVRTPEEFTAGHIEDALLIPDFEIVEKAEEMLPDKDATILVYCRTGRRSEIASRKLIEMGYTNVYDFGGIVDWLYEIIE
ncbi:MAG: rhodanese-like domain-containing protein [Bacillota bacterium]|nr:rhodanese-like domain-containing protein [Bacillota bacterium]